MRIKAVVKYHMSTARYSRVIVKDNTERPFFCSVEKKIALAKDGHGDAGIRRDRVMHRSPFQL